MSLFKKKKTENETVRPASGIPADSDSRGDILQKIAYLKAQLKRYPFPEFRFSPEQFERYFDGICYAAHSPGTVTSMANDILKHFGMPPENIRIQVEYVPENNDHDSLGTYSQNDAHHGTVVIRIKPSYTYDTVISIAAHECTHHFLFSRKIRLGNTQENERLTDIAALYLGCGFYYDFGSDLRSKVSREMNRKGETIITTTTSRLGYLRKHEFEFACTEITRIRTNHEQAVRKARLQYREKAEAHLSGYASALKKNGELLILVRNLKLICEKQRFNMLTEIFMRGQTEANTSVQQAFHVRLQKNMSLAELKLLCEEIQSKAAQLERDNEYLAQCQRIGSYQSMLGAEIHAYVAGIAALADNGNMFAMYEKLKFYTACPDSMDDAGFVFDSIVSRGGAEALYLTGKCYQEGVSVEKSIDMAKYYYYNAWLNGSDNAKAAMEELGA